MTKEQSETYLKNALRSAKDHGLINQEMVKFVLKAVDRSKANQKFLRKI